MSIDARDEVYMRLALAEARKGLGRTSPNPCVGALLVSDGEILARGYHHKAGLPHAEIEALRKAGGRAAGSTIYVTLEPCCHTGRTPPCSHALVDAGIRRVVIGMRDPNPLVNGGGAAFLRQHGIPVTEHVLEEQCVALNRAFIKYIETGTPYITLKAAVTLDGRLSFAKGEKARITGDEASLKVHQLRNEYDAILIGSGTVCSDDPLLTTRLTGSEPAGISDGRDAVRIVLDSFLRTPVTSRLYHLQSTAPTWVFCRDDLDPQRVDLFREQVNAELFPVPSDLDGHVDLAAVCSTLVRHGKISLLVEGGGQMHGAFLQQKLADRMAVFVAPVIAGNNGVSLAGEGTVFSRLGNISVSRYGNDTLIEGDIREDKPAACKVVQAHRY